MRTAFIKELEQQAEKDDRIFLICGDLGFSVLESFRDRFPKRFLNAGIAEQNMAGIAAGLAKEGYKVFIYSIGNFPSLRALEQIRYDICYHELDVTIVSVGAGFAYGPLGCSHHATEDLAIMRALPNMIVYNPADPGEARWSVREILKSKKASYLRLGKAGEPNIHHDNFELGPINLVKNGKNRIIISTGSIAEEVNKKIQQTDTALITIPYLSKSISSKLLEILKNYKEVITVEENQLSGGFGSFVLEIVNDSDLNLKIKRYGINDNFIGYAGSQSYLRKNIIEPIA